MAHELGKASLSLNKSLFVRGDFHSPAKVGSSEQRDGAEFKLISGGLTCGSRNDASIFILKAVGQQITLDLKSEPVLFRGEPQFRGT